MIISHLKGVADMISRMRSKDAEIQSRINAGMAAAGAKILQLSAPLVPVETGALKRSAFIRVTGSGTATVVNVGYSTSYALYVHEDLEAAHGQTYNIKYADDIKAGRKRKKGPLQQARYLIQPIEEHRAEIVDLIKKYTAEALKSK